VLVIVDAENVRRSIWPNVSGERLVELVAQWKDASGDTALVVFDGRAPSAAPGVETVGTGAETADDWIARRVGGLDEPFVLVTSDRELRERAGGGAERIVGGGAFVRELTRADANADEPRQRGDGA
jgi:predicted RNA-binding protein with PIN domain